MPVELSPTQAARLKHLRKVTRRRTIGAARANREKHEAIKKLLDKGMSDGDIHRQEGYSYTMINTTKKLVKMGEL